MKRFLISLATGSFVLVAGLNNAVAQDGDDDASARPVELYICSYNDGMGPADLDAVTAKWNKWADGQGLDDYSAWTLTKFYSGSEQDFDYIWLGAAANANSLGAAQDKWLTTGAEVLASFRSVSECDTHALFSSFEFKAAPEEERSNVVVSFSDCNIADGKNFSDDVAPAIAAWAKFRTEQGSNSGQYVYFPTYGGGSEEFDFNWARTYASHAEQGTDWDNWDADKARELFSGVIDCDSSRVYDATNRRRAASEGE